MCLFLLFGFILWGWAEMSAFIYIGGEIGGLFTLLGVFATAIIGLSLLKSQGGAVMTKIRTDLMQGRAPVGSVADSISLSVGGILMLIPGYVTDGIGILLFIPGCAQLPGLGCYINWSQIIALKALSMLADKVELMDRGGLKV